MAVDYFAAEGMYKIWPLRHDSLTSGVQLNLYLFMTNEEHQLVRRVGIKYRLLPATSDNIDSFPLRLVQLPLNEATFNDVMFPAPKEEMEIQKYHYKDNWWKDVKPKQCQ